MMCAGYPISLVGVHIHRPANLHAFCVTSKHLTQVCAAMSYRSQIYLKNHPPPSPPNKSNSLLLIDIPGSPHLSSHISNVLSCALISIF